MADSSSPRDDHFDVVLKAAERIQSAPPLLPPIPSGYVKPISEPPPYTVLGVIGVTICGIAVLELIIGVFMLLGGIGSNDSTLIVAGLSMVLGSVFVYAFGEMIRVLIVVAQNSFRQSTILILLMKIAERQSNGR